MKILCVSDQIDPLVYTNSIKERYKDVTMVLSAGDLPLDYLEFIVSSLNVPLLFVFGNHNTEHLSHFKPREAPVFHATESLNIGAIHIGGKIHRENGLIIAGLGGSMRYNRGENQFTERQMKAEIFKMIPALLWNRIFRGKFLDILLTHAPPEGIHDKPDPCHRGFKAFRWFMHTFKPSYLIHGHIHLYDLSAVRVTRFEETTVINAYSHYIVTTEEN
ncbi:metallophosphoesterase [Spirochaetia bacterium]|nr:metallophosphoesterase [Spirochaetia bacterium]